MTKQTTWRGLFAVALASSIMAGPFSTPTLAATQGQDHSFTPSQIQIDPHWRALTEQVDHASIKQRAQPKQAHVFAPTVHLNLSSGILSGRVDRPDPITISVRRGGVQVLTDSLWPVFEGSTYAFLTTLSNRLYLRNDDIVELRQANQTGSISLTVPTFGALLDAPSDIVAGYVTSHTLVHVQVNSTLTPTLVVTQDASVTAEHYFTANLSSLLDVRPRDDGFAWVDLNSNTHLYRSFSAPLLQVEAGGSIVASPNGLGGARALDVLDAVGNLRASIGLLTPSGSFAIPLTFTLNIGDRVIAQSNGISGNTVITIPRLSVQPDANGTHLIGDAPPNTRVELRVFNGPITDQSGSLFGSVQPITRVLAIADAQGKYAVALALAPANYVFAVYTTPSGHEVFARYTKPYIRVRLGPVNDYYNVINSGYEVVGQFSHIYEPVTITVQGASGYQKVERHTVSLDSGYFADSLYSNLISGNTVSVEAGDIVTVSTRSGEVQTVHAPEFQVSSDSLDHTVFGTAPPNSAINLFIPRYFYSLPLTTRTTSQANKPSTVVPPLPGYIWSTVITASANGTFSVTLPQFATYQESLSGEAELILADGNAVARAFSDTTICRPYVSKVVVGGNSITLANANCVTKQFQAQLWSSDGKLKWSANNLNQFTLLLKDANDPDRPILIESGDQIKLYQGDYSDVTTVPTFTVSANRAQNSVSGTAPPNATVNVHVYPSSSMPFIPSWSGAGYFTQTIADNVGHYHIAFGPEVTLTAGSLVEASIVDPRITVATLDAVPVVNAYPSYYEIGGRLKPLAPYTFTLVSGGIVTRALMRYADDTGIIGTNFGQIIRPNDQVQLDSPSLSTTFNIPTLTGEIDFEQGLLVGLGPQNARLSVWQWTSETPYNGVPITALGSLTVSAAGQYSLTLPSAVLAERANLNLSTRYDVDDVTRIWRHATVVPIQWRVDVNARIVEGTLPVDTSAISLTLRKANNPTVEITAATLYDNGFSGFIAYLETPIDSNDIFTLKTNQANYTFTVPLLSATYSDPISHLPIVTGITQPNLQVQVIIAEPMGQLYPQPVRRSITSDVNGYWGIDVSDVRPKLNSQIQFIYLDPFNNRVQRYILATFLNLAFPIVLRD